MMRKRESRLKLAPFTMSQAKCDAVDALPPLPQTKMWRPFVARFAKQLDGLVHFVQVDRLDRFQQFRLVVLRKAHMSFILRQRQRAVEYAIVAQFRRHHIDARRRPARDLPPQLVPQRNEQLRRPPCRFRRRSRFARGSIT